MGIVGQMVLWPVDRAPKGWLKCDGAEYGVTTAPDLWQVILQTYGSGGRSFGNLPNFGMRRALGAGQGDKLPSYPLGSSGNDATPSDGGVGFLGLPSIICAQGIVPWENGPGLLGTILPFGGERPPQGYEVCQGQLLSIGEHAELYSVIGVAFGGDGRTTFALPDLRGRAPLGADGEHQLGQAGEGLSVKGDYGYQAINYVMAVKPPQIGGPGSGDEPLLAEIIYTATTFVPRGWAFCQGQLLAINENPALFSLIGTLFGGDGKTTFALPDLRARIAVGTSIGQQGSFGTGGTGQVAYLSLNAMIAIQGIFPES